MWLVKIHLVCAIVITFSCVLVSDTVFGSEHSGKNIDSSSDFKIALKAEPEVTQFQDSSQEVLRAEGCDCGEYGTCSFDARDMKICNCSDGYKDYYGTCQQCDCGKDGKCMLDKDNEKVCKCDKDYAAHFGACLYCSCGGVGYSNSCSFVGFLKKNCVCNEGYGQYNDRCAPCDCKGNVTSSGCTIGLFEWSVTCPCAEGYAQDNKECKKCDCGGKGECSFSSGAKQCNCEAGYGNDNEMCKACDCGRHSYGCSFSDGKKTCDCHRFAEQLNDTCVECTCGSAYTYQCELDSRGEKNCTCYSGYAMNKGTCESCSSCQQSPNHCTFDDDGNKKCVCKDGFASKRGVCKECACGEESTDCYFIENVKQCQCKTGYEDVLGQCEDTNECLKSDSCPPEADCINTVGSYRCACRKGYSNWPYPGNHVCRDIDECGTPEDGPCYSSGAECFNTAGSYRCVCSKGYREGDSKQISNAPFLIKCVIASRPFRTSTIVFGTFFGLLFVAIGIYVYITNKRSRKEVEQMNEVGMR